ncbi:hypothetical protein LTR53_005872 [Teratosphaeriaceae sp. CCFEE 6253]|nr:hypothetical protein LTR53_005872 [Teratosphaeriaceae sp. CCFEE 6253]
MAAYYDPYDSRPRITPRTDSFSRPRDSESYVKPAAGYASPSHYERVGEVTARPDYLPRAQRYSYESRDPGYQYQYPPPPPPDVGRPGPPPRSHTNRPRDSWPPSPKCEEEAVSLAREAGTAAILEGLKEVGKDEVQSRGVIDQEPLIEEVPEFVNQDERRFVLASDSEKEGRSTGIPTPPTSEDERTRRLRRRPSRLRTHFDNAVPEVTRRTASPYAFTRPSKLPKDRSSSDRFLSPTTLTPPSTESSRRRQERVSTTPRVPSSRRESMRIGPSGRRSNDYFASGSGSSENAIADDDPDTSDSAPGKGRRRAEPIATQTYPPTLHSAQTDVKDFAAMTASVRRLNLDARRNTDVASSELPSLRVDKPRRPAPYMAAGALGAFSAYNDSAVYSAPGTPPAAELPLPRSREGSYISSRGVSPTPSNAEPSPPPSARQSRDMTYTKTGSSSPRSGAGSASASRPASPSPRTPADSARLPRTDLDWSTLLAANAARRSKPPSRLASSMRQDSVPDVNRRPTNAGRAFGQANVLPYPEDFPGSPATYIPAERDYQYFPPQRSTLNVPSTVETKAASRETSPAASSASRSSTGSRAARPGMPTRHTTTNVSPSDDRPRQAARRHDSFSMSSQTKKELSALMKKGLPDCPRAEAVAGLDDWYTVIGAPGLTFCPTCVDAVFERSIFRPSIRLLPQLNFKTRIGCAFGSSPWLRLAWLLTLQQQLADLRLLKDVAEIEESSEPCPGGTEAVRTWYGLQDNEGYYVKDFHLCYNDVRKIERLLPTLSGFFVRLPQRASYSAYTCAIRADGNRFSAYLDALISTHERAHTSRKGPDPTPFLALVARKTRLPECTRDNVLIGALWHAIPAIPSLTVCADCYDAVVEPEMRRNSDLALRMGRTVQPIYNEGMGSSCQLYSRRMRRVFARALEAGDARYLARKSRERREAEVRLQERYRDVLRRHRRISRDGGGDEEEEARLSREVEMISEEWKAEWE